MHKRIVHIFVFGFASLLLHSNVFGMQENPLVNDIKTYCKLIKLVRDGHQDQYRNLNTYHNCFKDYLIPLLVFNKDASSLSLMKQEIEKNAPELSLKFIFSDLRIKEAIKSVQPIIISPESRGRAKSDHKIQYNRRRSLSPLLEKPEDDRSFKYSSLFPNTSQEIVATTSQ